MAYRYLRASGNWNGPVWAATESGVAGSASTPTASDSVLINSGHGGTNYSLSLTSDVEASQVIIYRGSLSFNNYSLTTSRFVSNESFGGTRTIDFGSGKLKVHSPDGAFSFDLMTDGHNTTLIPGSSLIEIMIESLAAQKNVYFGGFTYNDVIISLGDQSGTSESIYVHGSPTFRSLTIQSKNSAAHTVNFDDGANITLDKLVLIGSSPSNRLKITEELDASDSVQFTFSDNATVYGQNINMWAGRSYPENPNVPLYIGSNSISGSGSTAWLLQDPPKISTLVDPLTTAPGSNPNWAVSGVVTQVTGGHSGGGYKLGDGPIVGR